MSLRKFTAPENSEDIPHCPVLVLKPSTPGMMHLQHAYSRVLQLIAADLKN